MSKRKLKKATDADVCYTIVICFLDGQLNGLERSNDINVLLREALQKIAALKLAFAAACKISDLDAKMIERECLSWVMKHAPNESGTRMR